MSPLSVEKENLKLLTFQPVQRLTAILILILQIVPFSSFASSGQPSSADWSQPPSLNVAGLPFTAAEILAIRRGLQDPSSSRAHNGRDLILAGGARNGSGGGGGVACLSTAQPGAVERVFSFDYYVTKLNPQQFISRISGESSFQFVQRVSEQFVFPAYPVLAIELRTAFAKTNPARWLNNPDLALVNDRDPSISIEPRADCLNPRYIQLVSRYDRNNLSGDPDIALDANFAWLRLLWQTQPSDVAFYNEAQLLMHEALYLIATKAGDQTSSRVVPLAAVLLSKLTYNSRESTSTAGSGNASPLLSKQIEWSLPLLRTTVTSGRLTPVPGQSIGSDPSLTLSAKIQAADARVQNLLIAIATRMRLSREYPIETFASSADTLSAAAQVLASESPEVNFAFATKMVSLYRKHSLTKLIAADIYLQPQMERETFQRFCRSIEFNSRGNFGFELEKIGKPILRSALSFCRELGMPAMTAQDTAKFLDDEMFRN